MARQPQPISYRATASELQQLACLASSLGCSRHSLIRVAVTRFLESQQITQTAANSLGNQSIQITTAKQQSHYSR